MPSPSHVDPRPQLSRLAEEDAFGHDRMAKAFLRSVVRLRSGSSVAVHGAPGSGKSQFMLRCAYLMQAERHTVGFDPTAPASGAWCWYNPWLYQKHGNILSGLVATMAHASPDPAVMDRARDIVGHINRMHFGEDMPDHAGTGINRGDLNPVSRVRQGFKALLDRLKAPAPGRVLVFIEDLDSLRPSGRLLLMEGLRLLTTDQHDVTFVLSVGRESAYDAMRLREGRSLSDGAASHCLAELVDLAITVPSMDVRKIGERLRSLLGDSTDMIQRAFGPDALDALCAACASRPLGMPRFLESLAGRIVLLSEFAIGTGSTRELSEAQWAWVIVSARWPDFRRFMLRGGRDRWMHLRKALANRSPTGLPADTNEITEWLDRDLIFADYLKLYADEFEREAEAVYWLETLQLACGL
ncbi:MAG: hypothetical protein GY913_23565 [Proteobacteria bacterium]|nr:hypothetical protein [Pseudomonadota bacterium]MCP4919892.1 hypothetical protein [Pseudomonadota bacterium]